MGLTGSYVFSLMGFLFVAASAFAQIPNYTIEGSAGTGKVIRNYPNFPDMEAPSLNGEVSFSKHCVGQKPWHRYYNFPRMGVSINGGSMGNDAVLGHYLAVMEEMTFEKRIGLNWFWAPQLSMGVAWFSKPHDEFDNPENVVIGSSFTFFVGARIMGGRRISPKFDLIAKVGMLHASNSHFQLPNVGMNLPLVTMGIRYSLKPSKDVAEKTSQIDTTRLNTTQRIAFHARVALGVNEFGSSTNPVNGNKYPVYLAAVYFSKMFSPVNKVTAGVEAWYNKGVYDFIVSQEFYDDKRHNKSCAAAITLGHEFLMGHFGLLTTGGIYFYNPFYKDRLEQNEIDGIKDNLKAYIPARLGVQYYVKNTNYNDKNNLFVGVYIKTNFGQADFLETGFGYMF